MDIVRVQDLKKSYRTGFWKKKQLVLKGVNFSIPKGTVTGFLGKNGAGKTSTLKCLLGLSFPDSGQIELFGQKAFDHKIRAKIGFLPERPYFYEYLTGTEFLKFYGRLATNLTAHELDLEVQRLLSKVELSHAKDKNLRNYSKGMLQRIGIAQALINDPEFIVFDEPMSGLDPDGRFKVSEIIKEVASQGKTIFFSSHLIHDMEQVCNHLVVLNAGLVAYEGGSKALLETFQKGYRILFSSGETTETEVAETAGDLQKKIDTLRKQGKFILEVRNERPSLEEAFLSLSKGA